MVGFISKEGVFYECQSYGHLYLAKEICVKLYNKDDFINRIEAESFLLSEEGFIILTARGSGFRSSEKNEAISDEQLEWISKNMDELNPMQKESLSEYLYFKEIL